MSENPRVMLDEYEAGELAVQYDDKEPQEVIAWALETFGRRVAISTSLDADPMAILDMAWRIDPKVRVFTIDTLRLPKESYDFLRTIEEHYGIAIETLRPDEAEVVAMAQKHGTDLFRSAVPLRLLCCDVRKVRPLQRILPELDAWITGLRRDQWASRSNIRKIELDHDHGGLVKVNPLADWMKDEVWDYIKANDVPVHPLHAKGYRSIGCDPCTRAVAPGADPRSGRWWWESNAPKECGMHCAIETGGFEHELEVIVQAADDIRAGGPRGQSPRDT